MLHSTIWEYAFNYMRVCIQTCSITGAYTTSLIHLWRAVLVCVTCLINMCDTPLLRVWRDSFIRVTWLMYMCNVLHSYVWHTPFIRVTCLMCLFAMTVLLCCSVAVLLCCSVAVLLCWPIHIFDMTRSRACWACHAMHKVVALASSSRPTLTCWRISAVWSVCIDQLL